MPSVAWGDGGRPAGPSAMASARRGGGRHGQGARRTRSTRFDARVGPSPTTEASTRSLSARTRSGEGAWTTERVLDAHERQLPALLVVRVGHLVLAAEARVAVAGAAHRAV